MALARLLDTHEGRPDVALQHAALDLARALPRLTIDARRLASALEHGLHGRRRAGTGEKFWQFRPFVSGEAASRVDWRRSGRDDRLYVREREWEAAHTVWLWCERSPSMAYRSRLAQTSKIERGMVLALALADLLMRGGERAGLLGLTRPSANAAIAERFAHAWLADRSEPTALPPRSALSPRTECVLIGDFLSPLPDIEATVAALAGQGAGGHLLMIADPVEETFPFEGRIELFTPDKTAQMLAGRVQSLREAYIERLGAHREAIRNVLRRIGWTMTLHRTDRPASEALLALHAHLQRGGR